MSSTEREASKAMEYKGADQDSAMPARKGFPTTKLDYYAECLAESLEEHGVSATLEQIALIARDVAGAYERMNVRVSVPMTKDGVLVFLGMTVYPPCGHRKPLMPSCFMPEQVKGVSCWEGSCRRELYGENNYHESYPTNYPVEQCFSTLEAALAYLPQPK